MKIIRQKAKAREVVERWKRQGYRVGFVPTMGALHQGHQSLVKGSVNECEKTAVSIFLNPAQFGPDEDLERYPKTLERDLELLAAAGTDMVFLPEAEEMYPRDFCTWVVQEKLTERLCGASRPGHFKGVCTVVTKLFAILPVQYAYFGRKDLQQSVVVKTLVRDLDIPVKIRVMPTVRTCDGLAISSRNSYLDTEQRPRALRIHESLAAVRKLFQEGQKDVSSLINSMKECLKGCRGIETEYAEIVDPETLETPEYASSDSVAAVAVFIDDIRLIDNMPLCAELEDIYLAGDN